MFRKVTHRCAHGTRAYCMSHDISDYMFGNIRPGKVWQAAKMIVGPPTLSIYLTYGCEGLTVVLIPRNMMMTVTLRMMLMKMRRSRSIQVQREHHFLLKKGLGIVIAKSYHPVTVLHEFHCTTFPKIFGRRPEHKESDLLRWQNEIDGDALNCRVSECSHLLLCLAKMLDLLKLMGNIFVLAEEKDCRCFSFQSGDLNWLCTICVPATRRVLFLAYPFIRSWDSMAWVTDHIESKQ